MKFHGVVILSKVNLPVDKPLYCMSCGHYMFKVNRERLVVYLGDGYPTNEIPLGMGLLTQKCRSCGMTYRVYWQ
jgi:hypothetical protein